MDTKQKTEEKIKEIENAMQGADFWTNPQKAQGMIKELQDLKDALSGIGKFDKGHSAEYTLKKEGNGVYAFVLEGDVEINNEKLTKRDGMGIWDTESITVKASENTRVLLMEVPMSLS